MTVRFRNNNFNNDGLDLDVRRGEVMGIVGASGTGKSVLMRAIIGLLVSAGGQIRLFGRDTAGMTPLMKMHTLGHDFIPDPIHAGGLRYHGMAPLISHVYELGLMDAVAIPQTECFSGAVKFARSEGIVPAPEPTHAIAQAIRLAEQAKETGEETVILTALCGHGHFDLAAYESYLAGSMVDETLSDERFAPALANIPTVPA